jgi:uncharacterized membrane protein
MRNARIIAVVVAVIAVLAFQFGRGILFNAGMRAANAANAERVRAMVEKSPQLRADFDRAMADGVLTNDEAKDIAGKAGQAYNPDD